MNPFYEIFNRQYIQQKAQQASQQGTDQQLVEVIRKLQDFLDSYDDVKDSYKKDLLTAGCCATLFGYLKKHNMI